MKTLNLAADNFDTVNTFNVEVETRSGKLNIKCSLRRDFEKKGDGIYWALKSSSCLKSSYSEADKAESARLANEEPVRNGEIVLINGEEYRADVRGNYSDAVVFRKI